MGRFRLLETVVIGITCLCVLAAVAALALALAPFDPLTFRSIDLYPERACPDRQIYAEVSYYFDPDYFDQVKEMEVKAEWIAEDVPTRPSDSRSPGGSATVPQETLQPGETDRESRVIRRAPDEPGVWLLQERITVRGSWHQGPVAQDVTVYANDYTTVLDAGDAECSGQEAVVE